MSGQISVSRQPVSSSVNPGQNQGTNTQLKAPAEIKIEPVDQLNPQPEPPSPMDDSGSIKVPIQGKKFLSPGEAQGLNSQPEPPVSIEKKSGSAK